jgi:WD40 repeat protein
LQKDYSCDWFVSATAAGVSRRIVRRKELSESGWHVAQKLATPPCRRLLVLGQPNSDPAEAPQDSDDAAFVVELAHEQLATQWNRYQRWLRRSEDDSLRAEDKRSLDRLMDRTERWAELGRRDRDLSLGGDLDDFSALCERREWWTSPLERDFVRRSLEAREQRLQEEADRRAYEQRVSQALRVSEALRLAMEARQAAVREPTTAFRLAWEAVLWDRNELSEGVFRESLDRLPAPVKVIAWSEGGKLSAGYGADGSSIFTAFYERSSIATWRFDGTPVGRFDVPDEGPWAIATAPGRPALLVGRGGCLSLLDLEGRRLASLALPEWTRSRYSEPECGLKIIAPEFGLFQQGVQIWPFELNTEAASLQPLGLIRLTDENGGGHLKSPFTNIKGISVDSAGQRILTNGADGRMCCWTIEGKLVRTIELPSGSVHDAEFLADGQVVTGNWGGEGHLWTNDSNMQMVFREKAGTDLFIKAVDRLRRHFVTSLNHDDEALEVWNADGQRQAVLAANKKHYWSAAFSPDGRLVCGGCEDGVVRIWEWEANRLVFELHGHGRAVDSVAFHPVDGASLLTTSLDGSTRLWSLANPIIRPLRGHLGPIRDIESSGELLISCGSEDGITLLRRGEDEPIALEGNPIEIVQGPSSRDILLTQDHQLDIRLWQVRRTPVPSVICLGNLSCESLAGKKVSSAAISSDGSRLVLGYSGFDGDGAELWSTDDRKCVPLVGISDTHTDIRRTRIRGFGFQAKTDAIVTGAENGMVWLWSRVGKQFRSFVADDASPDRLFDLTVDPLGEFILVGIRHEASLWNWSGEKVRSLATLGYKVQRVVVSPDGARLLTISDNPREGGYYSELWDREGGRVSRLEAPEVSSTSWVHFDVHGRYVLTRSSDLRIFDFSGKLIGVLAAARGVYVSHVAISPDGGRILALFTDCVLRLWDFQERRRKISIQTESSGPVCFSPDGQRILIGTSSGAIDQIALDITDLFSGAATRLDRGLSNDEIQRFAIQTPVRLNLVSYSTDLKAGGSS